MCFYDYVHQNDAGMILGFISSIPHQGFVIQAKDMGIGGAVLLLVFPIYLHVALFHPDQCPLPESVWPLLHWLWGLRLCIYLMGYNP